MKAMKKVIALVLAAVMVLGLAACGGNKAESAPSAAPQATETKSDAAEAPKAAAGEFADGAVLAEEGSGYLYDSMTIGTTVFGSFQTGVYPVESDPACSLVFDVVFKTDPDTQEVYSDILEDFHFEDDNTLIMKMKENITFSNGEPATAEDLLFSYTSHVDRSSAYTMEYNIDYENSKCLDDYTVEMKFTQFYSAFFSSYIIYLYDKSWAEEVGWDSTEWHNPVGSGPYACTEYVSDDHMTFVARDDYWNKDENPVVIRQWNLKYYADPSTMAMDMEVGNLALCSLESVSYERFLKEGGKGYDVINGDAGVTISFNFGFTENPCWYDEKVRKAFAIGIPWAELGEISLGVAYKPATSVVPESSPEYLNVGTYEYDVEAAKALLKEAGYDENNKLTLKTVMMDTPFYNSSCEAFQYYASQLGVDFTFENKDVSATIMDWMTPGAGCELGFYYDNFGSMQKMLVRSLDWANNPFGSTWTYIDDEGFHPLYDAVAFEKDTDKRIEASKVLQQYIYDNYLAVPYAELSYQVAYRTAVFGDKQLKAGVMNRDYYNLSNMSYASVWA